MMSASGRICQFNAILIISLLISQITSAVEIHEVADVLAMPPESIGKEIDKFLEKLGELEENPPKVVDEKYAILCKETQVTLEYLEKISAFLELLNELTEKMKPYRQHYPSLATFNDRFHERCVQCIEQMKVGYR
jgi:hypothetical protein